jgi:hypothetical protein
MRFPGVPRWCGGHHPEGDTKSGPIRLTFNPQLRVEFRGATVTSNAGLLLPRELDKRLGLDALIELARGAWHLWLEGWAFQQARPRPILSRDVSEPAARRMWTTADA